MNELLHLNFSNSSNWKFHLLKSKNCAKLFGISQSFFEEEKNFALQHVISGTTKLLDWFPLFILHSSSSRREKNFISIKRGTYYARKKNVAFIFSASNDYHFENRFLLFFSRWLPIDWFKVVQIVIVYQYPK